jgi:hypothetical protein
MTIPSITLVICLWCGGNGFRLLGSTSCICHRLRGTQRGIGCRRGICRCRRYDWLADHRQIGCRAPVKPPLQTFDLFEQ